jgi:hypothetical protein
MSLLVRISAGTLAILTEAFCGIAQSTPDKRHDISLIRPRLLPTKTFSIHPSCHPSHPTVHIIDIENIVK